MMHLDVSWNEGGRPLRVVLFHSVLGTVMGAGPSAGRERP